MKKNKSWKQLASLILVLLMFLQSPVAALAEDGFSAAQNSQESFFEDGEAQEDFISDETKTGNIETGDTEAAASLIKNPETDAFTSEGTTEEPDGFASEMAEMEAADPEVSEEIQVTVSVSKDGSFLNDKTGTPMAGRTVTLNGKSSYTMDDALKMAHDLYYPGGSDAGYDFHEDETGNYDGLIYKLWGYNRADVPYIRFSLNNDSKNYVASLTRSVENGDDLHFYIQQRAGKDRLAFFTETEKTVSQGEQATLRLRQSDTTGYYFSNCQGAAICIDGVKQDGLVTDADGNVTLPVLEPRDTPYFVTAVKQEHTDDGSMATMISAAYARVTVVPSGGLTGEYLEGVKLRVEGTEESKELGLTVLDGSQAFVLSTDSSHDKFSVSVTTKSSLPENSEIYAVYTNPADESICRVKLSEGSYTALKNTSVLYSVKAIQRLKIEVRQAGALLQAAELPICYKARMRELTLTDSWGHQSDCGLADSIEDQNLEVVMPQNTEYIDIQGRADSWGYLTNNPELVSVENAECTVINSGSSRIRFVPDWTKYEEYKILITLKKSDEKIISADTRYVITVKKGDVDYTPVISDKDELTYYNVLQGQKAEPFTVNATVLRQEEGKLSYQWYKGELADQLQKIEGATDSSYTVPTEEPQDFIFYRCMVSYEMEGKIYSAFGGLYNVRVYPTSLDAPVITKQPEDLVCVKDKPVEQELSVELQDIGQGDVKILYQWYKNTENSTENGILIPGATSFSYKPEAKETGKTYYYCRIRYQLRISTDQVNRVLYSDPVFSDVVSVTVVEEPLPWEGAGTIESPYLIKNSSELEALRDKVNTEGFSFEDTYFQLADDITLPDGWKPIGATKNGRVDLQGGANLNAFSGIFDGIGHTVTVPEGGLPLFGYVRNTRIRNLNIYGKRIAGYGLVNNFEGVGLAGSAVEIDNVTLKSGSSTLKSGLLGANMTMSAYAGCSAAFVATIQNCTIEKDVVIGYDKTQKQIGSIAGRMQGTVKNCVSYATVYGTDYVGGIIGTRDNALGTCTVTDCKFYGNVNASGEQAGGIVGGGYSHSSAPNGAKVTIKGCSSEGNITGKDKVGGILGADIYVAQAWDNCRYSLKNNSFTGTVQATGENAASIGGIIGFYDSLNRIDDISNNYYREGCGAQRGVGFVRYVDTNCTTHETASGAIYINTESDTTNCPKVEGCGWQAGYNRTDDPLGADMANLFSTDGLRVYVDSLELSGNYRTEFDVGEALDFSGMKVTAYISDGTAKELSWTDLSIEGYNPNLRGEQKLKLSYKEAFVELTITVLKKDAGTITVSFTLLGDKKHNSDTDGECHTLHSGNLETWVSKADYKVDGNSNVLAVLKEVLAKNNMIMRTAKEENYIAGITRNGEPELAEFTNGNFSGWMYTLNEIHSDLGVKEQYLEDGDEIVFHYTDDYKKEHDHVWDEKWTSDTEAHWHECMARYDTCDITDNAKKAGYQKHNYGSGKVLKAATCKDEGVMEYTCVVCGYTKTETIPKTSQHTYDNGTVTKAATYLEAGEIVYTCTVCGAKKSEAIPVVPHTHNFTWKTISAATVFTPEKQEGACTICGEKQNREKGSALKAVLKLNVTSLTLQKKQSTKAVKVTMANGDAVKSWASSNKKIVTVDKNGKIKAGKKTGTAKITVTLKSGKKATLKVKVQNAKVKTTKITGLKTKLTLKKGKSVALKPVISPITSQEKVTYTSSNRKVATVTKAGVIKGKKKGTATITVKSGKVTKRIKVTVR